MGCEFAVCVVSYNIAEMLLSVKNITGLTLVVFRFQQTATHFSSNTETGK